VKNPRTRLKSQSKPSHSKESDTKTFIEHIQELRNRLFWIVIVLILASAAAYPFFDKILAILVGPLGSMQLYYLTPSGGFSFILKVCMYVGLVAAVPMMIYQFFRYIQPVMGTMRHRTIIGYIASSIFLAATGIVLAYFVSLPAALHFLTDFNLPQISAMLTADSYFSFVMTYLLAAAVLFQLPLVLMIMNNVTPMNPGSMMKQQRYVVIIAFILGGIISPTPDALNQALLAGPIIAMYQLSIFLVMAQNHFRKRRTARLAKKATPVVFVAKKPVEVRQVSAAQRTLATTLPSVAEPSSLKTAPTKAFFVDVITPGPVRRPVPKVTRPSAAPHLRPPSRPVMPRPQKLDGYSRSIDGFAIDA